MKFRALLILGLLFTTMQLFAGEIVKADTVTKEPASKKEIVKTGYNFGPLPAIAFDADKGFQLGALLILEMVLPIPILVSNGILKLLSLQRGLNCM